MHKKLRIFSSIVLILFLLTILFYKINKMFSALTSLLASIMVVFALYEFLSYWKRKRIGDIKIESLEFIRTYVLRVYIKSKNLWIFFDNKMKLFRPAYTTDIFVRVIAILLLGAVFIYTSYLIIFTITYALEFLIIRAIFLFILVVTGFYALFIGIARIFALGNKNVDKMCRFLNKNKLLKSFMIKEKAFMQITPNFLFSGGSVTSIEFILQNKPKDVKKIEKILIGIAKEVNKLK